MIAGITGNTRNGKEKISIYLKSKYRIKYVDVDKLIEELLLKEDTLKHLQNFAWQQDTSFNLKLRYQIDNVIKDVLENTLSDEILILDYSLLEDSYFIDKCNTIIKVKDYENIKFNQKVDFLKFFQQNNLNYRCDDRMYQLQLDLNDS